MLKYYVTLLSFLKWGSFYGIALIPTSDQDDQFLVPLNSIKITSVGSVFSFFLQYFSTAGTTSQQQMQRLMEMNNE